MSRTTATVISLLCHADYTNQIYPSTSILTADTHLWHVRAAIHKARNKWEDIGRALGVPPDDLESIHSRYNTGDADGERLYRMLQKWMQTDRATIHELLGVLENDIIGHKDLAKEIRSLEPAKKAKIGLM